MTTSDLRFSGSLSLEDGLAVVALGGEIDISSVPIIRGLLSLATAAPVSCVVIDLAAVSFCDAHGLGVLVEASARLGETGRRLSVQSASESLRTIFRITELTDLLDLQAPPVPAPVLLHALGAATRQPMTRTVLDAALKMIVTMSQTVMSGADGVSITLPRDGRLRTVAASNDVVLHMDHDQYDTGQGPCLDAAIYGERFQVDSLDTERRWPQFVPRARARGIQCILSTPLISPELPDHPLGALNVYSRTPKAFALHEHEWADQFAREASGLLVSAEPATSVESVNSDLAEALQHREVIAQAQGIMMARQHVAAETAQRRLMDVSRQTSRPLLDICRDVVGTAGPGKGARGTPVESTEWKAR